MKWILHSDVVGLYLSGKVSASNSSGMTQVSLCLTLFRVGKLSLGVGCAGPVGLVEGYTRCPRCGPRIPGRISKKKLNGRFYSKKLIHWYINSIMWWICVCVCVCVFIFVYDNGYAYLAHWICVWVCVHACGYTKFQLVITNFPFRTLIFILRNR